MAKTSDNDTDLKERIVLTTEKLLRRYGASKLSVVDVAREMGISHGNVYRFFGSKSELLGEVAERLLCKVMIPLTVILQSDTPADTKLVQWIDQLRTIKRERHQEDPELFGLYVGIAEQAEEVVAHHIEAMLDQLEQIINDGNKQGIFHVKNSRLAAAAVLGATSTLHHPKFVSAQNYPTEVEARYLINMVVTALKFSE